MRRGVEWEWPLGPGEIFAFPHARRKSLNPRRRVRMSSELATARRRSLAEFRQASSGGSFTPVPIWLPISLGLGGENRRL